MKRFLERVIGIVLVVLGALPFLLKIPAINTSLSKITWLTWFFPGEVIYQIVIILIGLLLLFERQVEYNF